MKKANRVLVARRSAVKKVNLGDQVLMPETNRSYGLMKTKQSRTPFPRPSKPVDLVALAAKLKEATNKDEVSTSTSIVDATDRNYSLMRTPFPRPTEPIDLVALTAKLKEGTKQVEASASVSTVGDHQTERQINFAERRKLFDMGEFTICKGRKLGDEFHPIHSNEQKLHIEDLHTRLTERQSVAKNFDEMSAYCLANDIKLSRGSAEFNL